MNRRSFLRFLGIGAAATAAAKLAKASGVESKPLEVGAPAVGSHHRELLVDDVVDEPCSHLSSACLCVHPTSAQQRDMYSKLFEHYVPRQPTLGGFDYHRLTAFERLNLPVRFILPNLPKR